MDLHPAAKYISSAQLLIAIVYQTLYQSNAKTIYSYLMVGYEMNLIRIFPNINENISNELKIVENSRGYT